MFTTASSCFYAAGVVFFFSFFSVCNVLDRLCVAPSVLSHFQLFIPSVCNCLLLVVLFKIPVFIFACHPLQFLIFPSLIYHSISSSQLPCPDLYLLLRYCTCPYLLSKFSLSVTSKSVYFPFFLISSFSYPSCVISSYLSSPFHFFIFFIYHFHLFIFPIYLSLPAYLFFFSSVSYFQFSIFFSSSNP